MTATTATVTATKSWPEPVATALSKASGARFYRCALQVNPFAYLSRHAVETTFTSETAYNNAIVDACKHHAIEVIAVTDHYRINTAESLIHAARAAGIQVYPGFEASTKEGVHFLCLFDRTREVHAIERIIGDCGIHGDSDPSPVGKHDAIELIDECYRNWGGVCIAAHVAARNGLLATLSGTPCINAWTHEHLLACSLPGPATHAPEQCRLILLNKNAEYRRERPIAILNCHDVSDPADFEKDAASCWVKMSEVTVEALRQAFLDPESRVRLASDPTPEDHTEFIAIGWEGGFLDGCTLRFSENLNALIGGRGTGKSTIVESIRYVLGTEPLSEESKKQHKEFVKHVLRNGTRISLLIRSHHPASREYLIEATVPNRPVVRDSVGSVTNLSPADVVPETEVYGQHELSELTRNPEKLTLLLERFVQRDRTLDTRKNNALRELENTRAGLLKFETELHRTESQLQALPALEEKLKRYQELGLEEKLEDRSQLVEEQRALNQADETLAPFREFAEALDDALPIDTTFLSDEELGELPALEMLKRARPVLDTFSTEAAECLQRLRDAITKTENGLSGVRSEWDERKKKVEHAYAKILRNLQKENIDGQEFIQLREQISTLKPLKTTRKQLRKQLADATTKRKNVVTAWESLKAEEFRELEKAAKRVTNQLSNRVRVTVEYAGNRKPLRDHLRSLSGRTSEMIQAVTGRDGLSLSDLATKARSGKEELVTGYGMPAAQAQTLALAEPDFLLRLEELDLPATTTIQLNIAPEGTPSVWRALAELSTGQKATAVLLLLLLESEGPLVVDQPEDDLDNRFITEGVVPTMRQEKRRRQFVFATHNANIPVLGDAELIIALSASGEAERGRADIPDENVGSIDSKHVQELVEEILEGGKTAFETRRRKYGF